MDYGRKDMVYLKNLRNIPEEFTQLPIQAIHCSLWGVYPIGTLDGGWHSESKTVVDSFLAGQFSNTVYNYQNKIYIFMYMQTIPNDNLT